jgi:3-hydroxy-3-methylglutaryl CoA synthase/uncharacterized OB-fold protein
MADVESTPFGIGGYAAHLPAFSLAGTTFGVATPVEGARQVRSVANHDEDAVTLAVEAARYLAGEVEAGATLAFATSELPYLDKSSAATVHAAVGLPHEIHALDLHGLRSGAGALEVVLRTGGIAVLADLRTMSPGAPDELGHGDGAAAFTSAPQRDAAVTLLGSATATLELLDRWRLPGAVHPRAWDERFTADAVTGPTVATARVALDRAGVEQPDHVVVSCANPRAALAVRRSLGSRGEDAQVDALIGHTGAAHAGILLADALDRAAPGETILLLGVADGVDAMVLSVGDGIRAARRGRPVREQIAAQVALTYERYLRIRRLLSLQGARRPDPPAPASPPMLRNNQWKYALVASRCSVCGAVETPPGRVCPSCGATDVGEPYSLRDVGCTVVSVTLDRLAPTPDLPVSIVVVDVDGGGRRSSEVTDVPPTGIAIGDRLIPTFRRFHSADGIHNYFWKTRPEAP